MTRRIPVVLASVVGVVAVASVTAVVAVVDPVDDTAEGAVSVPDEPTGSPSTAVPEEATLQLAALDCSGTWTAWAIEEPADRAAATRELLAEETTAPVLLVGSDLCAGAPADEAGAEVDTDTEVDPGLDDDDGIDHDRDGVTGLSSPPDASVGDLENLSGVDASTGAVWVLVGPFAPTVDAALTTDLPARLRAALAAAGRVEAALVRADANTLRGPDAGSGPPSAAAPPAAAVESPGTSVPAPWDGDRTTTTTGEDED